MSNDDVTIELLWEEPARFENIEFLRDDYTYWRDSDVDLVLFNDNAHVNPAFPEALLQNKSINRYFVRGHMGEGVRYVGGITKLAVFNECVRRMYGLFQGQNAWAYRAQGMRIRRPQSAFEEWAGELVQSNGDTSCDYLVRLARWEAFRVAFEAEYLWDVLLGVRVGSGFEERLGGDPRWVMEVLSQIAERTSRSLRILKELTDVCDYVLLREVGHDGSDILVYTGRSALEALRGVFMIPGVKLVVEGSRNS